MEITKKYHNMLFEKSVIGLALCRMNGELVEVNPAYAAILGRSVDETLKLTYWEITPQEYESDETAQLRSIEETGQYGPYEKEYIHADGHRVPVRLSGQLIEQDGEQFIWSSVENISEQKQAARALHESETRLANFFEATFECIFFHDGGIILDANPATTAILGFRPEEITGRNILEFIAPEFRHFVKKQMARKNDGPYEIGVINRHGEMVFVEAWAKRTVWGGKQVRVVALRDVTERKQAETRLEHLAHHDDLTGLPNRLFFMMTLESALLEAKQRGNKVALMFLDLDRFKYINDTLGHDVGDELLIVIAERLQNGIRGGDFVARLGGDEFTVILPDIKKGADAGQVADKLVKLIRQPVVIDGNLLDISTSLGISLYPDDAGDSDGLVKAADTAMYHAKASGKNTCQFYNFRLAERMLLHARLGTDLRAALENDEFEVYYQPQVNLKDGRVTGVEALIRWNHPQLGKLTPESFLHIADDLELVDPITEWVMRRVCRDHALWKRYASHDLRLAINITGRQISNKNSIKRIIDLLDELRTTTGVSQLNIDVTDSQIDNVGLAVDSMRLLKEGGITVVLDDFGTGSSSLNHLKYLPVSALKIDRSFISDIATREEDKMIAGAIISLAKSLNLKVVGEGVEKKAQFEVLRELDCDEMQGFYFKKPVSASAIGQVISKGYAELV